MPSLLDPLSSITSFASGLDTGATLENEAPPTRPTPPATSSTGGGSADKEKGDEGKEGNGGEDEEKEQSWWEWLTHKADGIEEWVDQFIQDHVKGGKGGDDGGGEKNGKAE